jgi:hypothetical protein
LAQGQGVPMSLDDIRNRSLDIRRRLNQIKDSL